MSSSAFARLALLLPYVPLIESVLYFVFRDITEEDKLHAAIAEPQPYPPLNA